MSKVKPLAKKLRLIRKRRQTKWAPFWIIPKIEKGMKKAHPSKYTYVKRSWKKTRIKP